MSLQNRYIDSKKFLTATAVYDDINLTIKSPDGYYQFNNQYRYQLDGLLGPLIDCITCALPCGELAGENDDINGIFKGTISGGSDTGAIVIYFIVGANIPDGVLTTYDGQTYNQLTYIGNSQGPVGLNTPAGQPTYFGSPNATPTTTGEIAVYAIQTDGSFRNTGETEAIVVNNSQLDLRGSQDGNRVFTHVLPKSNDYPSIWNVDVYAPIVGTFFAYQTDCPIQLDSFTGSPIQQDDTCADATVNYYFVQNATVPNGGWYPTPVFTPQTLTTPGIGNYVFLDDGAVEAVAPGEGKDQYIILEDDTYIQVEYGIVISTGTCTPAGFPCGGSLFPPRGDRGIYQLSIDAGTTVSDTGALLVYFDPLGFPDGIRVLYDGVYYNRLSSQTNGNLQSTSGVADAFTILGDPTNTCVPNLPNTASYAAYNGYVGNTWTRDTPANRNITINAGDDIRGGVNQMNMIVIPKPNPSPGELIVEVIGPCDGTQWNIAVQCPANLPSFTASANGASVSCGTATDTLFFGRFINATNAYPVVNNPVFLDHDGVTRATDQNYIMDNGQYITVTNGVVSSVSTCTPIP